MPALKFTLPVTGTAPNEAVTVADYEVAIQAPLDNMGAQVDALIAGFNPAGAWDPVTAFTHAIEAQAAAILASTSAQRAAYTVATWTALAAITGTAAGQGAEVLDADTGTHTDPVVGGTVANAGRFTWSASPAGWKWIGGTGLSGKQNRADISNDSGLSYVVVDQSDHPTWIEADLAGNPTARVGALLGPKIVELGGTAISADTGLSFVLTAMDGNGKVCATDLELQADGRFSPRAIRSIAARLTPADLTAALAGYQPVSGPAIACLGDSLTAGAGGTPYPTVLASLTGRTVTNMGVGGETSATITGRTGARPMLVTFSGGSIPTSGGVTVTLAGDNATVAPLLQGDGSTINPCSIAGVVGVLTYASSVYTFTRSTPGTAVAVAFPMPLITSSFTLRANDILIYEMGQNDSPRTISDIIDRTKAMIEWQAPLKKLWLVGGFSTATASSGAANELALLQAFGRRFVNIREWLSSQACQTYLGLTPDAGNLADMALGKVPANLLSDAVHLNTAGYAAKAYFYYQRGRELGYWS